MLYAATSIWLVVIVLLAWCVHSVCSSMLKPKAVNLVLLPGTLIAQLGRVIGLLITGAKINNTALMDDSDAGEPATSDYEPKIPVFGPVIVGFLPMLATGTAMYLLLTRFGMPVVTSIAPDLVSQEPPSSLALFWEQLRSLITLAEDTLNALVGAEMVTWEAALFAYLMTCLTVRLSPYSGNVRGHIGAIVGFGGLLALASTLGPGTSEMILSAWPLIALTIGWLLLISLICLVARGIVLTIQMVSQLQ